jgi:hypothetical protein
MVHSTMSVSVSPLRPLRVLCASAVNPTYRTLFSKVIW